VQIRILGSAAGGGVPQWNCNCANCRNTRGQARFISQSSAAISGDGRQWVLLNASPDLPHQFASFPALAPRGKKSRGTSVAAVVLTDAEMDHVVGLLSLREEKSLHLVSTRGVQQLLTREFPLLPILEKYCRIRHSTFPLQIAGLRISAFEMETDKDPIYCSRPAPRDTVVGLRLQSRKAKSCCVYLPALPAITKKLEDWVAGCDCLVVDGAFWSDHEMISLGLSKRTARDMGHVPISGKGGSLEWLEKLDIPRKIYHHINNSNPVLRASSRERKMVESAGVEISRDGMNIFL
jgi:pyrroloquinoline quinone biosynthesis protein B